MLDDGAPWFIHVNSRFWRIKNLEKTLAFSLLCASVWCSPAQTENVPLSHLSLYRTQEDGKWFEANP